ncbi:MAG: class I SAM-dependent methyltransferase [Aeromicrobium sp.]
MLKLRKTDPGEPLVVSMTGLRVGDRVLIVGAEEHRPLTLLAVKPGLSGRVCLVDEDEARTTRGAGAAEREGALVEPTTAPLTMLPFDPDSFDVVVANHVMARLGDRRIQAFNETLRVLRPAGRCVVIDTGRRSGLGAILGGGSRISPAEVEDAMRAAAFTGVRTLVERDGLLFVEGARRKS